MRRALPPRPEAIEVELSDKSNRRLDEILGAWRWAVAEMRFSRVRYLCLLRVLPYVERAIGRARIEAGCDWLAHGSY